LAVLVVAALTVLVVAALTVLVVAALTVLVVAALAVLVISALTVVAGLPVVALLAVGIARLHLSVGSLLELLRLLTVSTRLIAGIETVLLVSALAVGVCSGSLRIRIARLAGFRIIHLFVAVGVVGIFRSGVQLGR